MDLQLLQRLLNQSHALLMGFGGEGLLVLSVRVVGGAEARDPHLPVLLERQLDVLHVQSRRLPVFGEQRRRVDQRLDELVGDRQQHVLHIVLQLFVGVHLLDQLLETRFVQNYDRILDGGRR